MMGLLSWAITLWHLAAASSTSFLCILLNRQHLVPFGPQNPQLLQHKWSHFLNPIITGSTLQSQSLCQRATFQNLKAEEPAHTWDGRRRARPLFCGPEFPAIGKPEPPAV